ncbi:MAG: toxic anion resistance protein [Luteimonas sp.]
MTSSSIAAVDSESLRAELMAARSGSDAASQDAHQQLAQQAEDVVARLLETDAGDARSRHAGRDAIQGLGHDQQVQVARKSALLAAPIRTLADQSDDGGPIARALVDLKLEVEALDPARVDFSPGWFARMVGWLPFVGTPIKRYFSRYESAATTIDAIVSSLNRGREQLQRDSITLQADQEDMRDSAQGLSRAIALAQEIDRRLETRLADLSRDDPRHGFVEQELLFPLRQRNQDLQQQLAVAQQGVLTTELIVRNNRELIRGVDRATNVTVNALQVAVTLALALANQKVVLKKIEAINTSTDSLIAGTATRLREQGVAIHRQAASTQLDVETLKQAFVDIRAALDDVAQFRAQALPDMARNIAQMDELTAQSREAIERIDQAHQSRPALNMDLG